jgi:hypothetical protein
MNFNLLLHVSPAVVQFTSPAHLANSVTDFEPVQEENITMQVHDLDNFEEYRQREMPQRFKSLLDTYFHSDYKHQPGSDSWKSELVSLVELCHASVLGEYRLLLPTDQTSTYASTPTLDKACNIRQWSHPLEELQTFGNRPELADIGLESEYSSSWGLSCYALDPWSGQFSWDGNFESTSLGEPFEIFNAEDVKSQNIF